MTKAARFKIVARRPDTVIRKIGTEPLPRRAVVGRYFRPWVHIDVHLRHHFEPSVRMLKLDVRQCIAKGVDLVAPTKRRGLDFDGVLQTLLERRRTRHEVQEVMSMQHVACVLVGRSMMDAIAHVMPTSTPTAKRRCARNAASKAGPRVA